MVTDAWRRVGHWADDSVYGEILKVKKNLVLISGMNRQVFNKYVNELYMMEKHGMVRYEIR